ncbi:MAG: type 4a pilus biogenesis protein PilO [Patescibacteria group bacterium]
MKASTKRLLALMGSAALILSALIIYVALVKPEYNKIQDLRGRVKSSSDFYNAQAQAVDYVNNLYAKNKIDIEQTQKDLVLALPDQEEVANVVFQIQRISALNNISIDSVNLDRLPIQQKSTNSLIKNHSALRISMKLAGSYESFKELLKFLESNVRIINLGTLRVYQANELEKGIFNYELVVDTYYQVK